MKAVVYGFSGEEPVLLGEVRLRGDRLVYAVHPKAPPTALPVLKKIITEGYPRFGDTPARYLEALPFLYDSPYLRAKFVGDTVEKAEWDESEHPRDERGRFAIGGGGNAGNGHPLYGGKGDEAAQAEAKAAADEYDAAPEVGPGAKEAWAKLADDTNRQYESIASKIKVERVTGQPYATAEEMNADIAAGTFKVTTDNSEHPLWDVDQNFKFRVVHDYIGHYVGQNDFSMEGERSAFLEHARHIEDGDARKAAQVEVHSQAAAFTKHGVFQKQKVYIPKTVLRDTGLPKQSYRESVDAGEFIAARDKSPRGDFFSKLEPSDLADHKLILNKEGNAGAAVAPDGDIQNVFRNPGAPRGAGTVAALEGVKHGGFMLDAYDYERKGRPGLPDVYRKAGFVETGRMKFNPQYRPAWAPERQPDVVFMAYVGGDQSGSPKSTRYYASNEWDKAKADSTVAAKEAARSKARRNNARARSRGEGGPGSVFGKSVLSPKDREDLKIKTNKKKWGSRPHVFTAAEWTHPNGHPRCVRCGDEEPTDGLCMPELLKWAALLDTALSGGQQVDSGKIESQGVAMPNWIETFHSACITKGEACGVKWPICPAQKAAKVAKYITHEGGSWQVRAESGKVLGTHSSEADAKAQLAAIEANKTQKGVLDTTVAPSDATVVALQKAWDAYAKAVGIVFKSEEVRAEPVEQDVYRIAAPGGRWAYFAVDGDTATRVEYQRKSGMLTPVLKAEKQRYTLGAVYAPGEVDFHGDTMTEQELEKAAWAFAQKDGLTGRVGLMHQSGTEKAGRVVESYIYRGPVWKFKDTSGTQQTIEPGTWMLGVVWESEGWAKIERGAVRGYSLQGVARKFANGEEV